MTDAAYDPSDDVGTPTPMDSTSQPVSVSGLGASKALPLWQFDNVTPGGFQPTGDPLNDHFTQAIRYAVGLDDPADASPGLSSTIDVLRGPQAPPQFGLLTGPATSSLATEQRPPVAGGLSGDDVQQQQLADLKARLALEGRRHDVYVDSLGHLTVGVGHKVLPQDGLKFGDVIGDDRIDQLLGQDMATSLARARSQAAQAGITDPDFIAPLGAVNFQLGSAWTGKFPKAWRDIKNGDYEAAAQEVARGSNGGLSDWASQTPGRVAPFQAALRALPPKPDAGH